MIHSFTKLMGFKIRIPESFRENEDIFMRQLISHLRHPFKGNTFWFKTPQSELVKLSLAEIFTDEWEFTDEPDESHYNYALDDFNFERMNGR